ncbi:MAG: hypothetical protein WKF96_23555 [Solirubrobacteraceae bacterium]
MVGWNADISDAGTGLDADVFAGLYMATSQGLLFGSDVYGGPLSFLKYPAAYDLLLTGVSFAYTVLIQLLTAALLVWAGHRALGRWPLATLFAAVATSIRADARIYDIDGPSPVNILAFVACARAMRSDSPPRLRTAIAGSGGALAAIELLAKINVGLLVTATILFTLIVVDRRRHHLSLFAVAFVVTAASAWFLTGQTVGNLDDYVQLTFSVARSYTLTEASGQALWGQSFPLLLVLAVPALVLLAGAWLSTRDQRVSIRIAVTVLTFGFVVALLKFGFLTFGHHGFVFFTSIVSAWFAFQWAPDRRVAVLGFVVLVGAYYGGAAVLPPDKDDSTLTNVIGVNPLNQRPTSLLDTMLPREGRAAIRRDFELDARTVQLIGSRPVHAAPSVVWAYEFNWKPLPVFLYSLAGTPFTDQANAQALRTSAGPDRILRDEDTGPFLRSPKSEIALLCNFRHLYADSVWQVLGREPSRCGSRRVIRSVNVRPGVVVGVPSLRNTIVTASIRGIEPSALRTAGTPFLSNPSPRIALDGQARTLAGSTATEGLVVSVPRGLDYPGPFRLARDAQSLSILDVGAGGRPESLSITFRATPVRRQWEAPSRGLPRLDGPKERSATPQGDERRRRVKRSSR